MTEKIKIARRKNARVIPYGYEVSEEDPDFLIQNEEHMELIKKAKIGILVTGRMKSSRLPRKALKKIGNLILKKNLGELKKVIL